MAQRTTTALVGELLENDKKAARSVQPFIDTAANLVDKVVECAEDDAQADSTLELMERWLSAHFYCMSDPTYASKSTKASGATFTGQTQMHLNATRYGQSALMLDYSGCLASLTDPTQNVQQEASGFWLGKPTSERLDYDQRN